MVHLRQSETKSLRVQPEMLSSQPSPCGLPQGCTPLVEVNLSEELGLIWTKQFLSLFVSYIRTTIREALLILSVRVSELCFRCSVVSHSQVLHLMHSETKSLRALPEMISSQSARSGLPQVDTPLVDMNQANSAWSVTAQLSCLPQTI